MKERRCIYRRMGPSENMSQDSEKDKRLAMLKKERAHLEKEVNPFLSGTPEGLESALNTELKRLENSINAVVRAARTWRDIDNQLATENLSPMEKLQLNTEESIAKKKFHKLRARIEAHLQNLRKLYVYTELAQRMDAAGLDRKDWTQYSQVTKDSWSRSQRYEIGTINRISDNATVPIHISDVDAKQIVSEISDAVDKYKQTLEEIEKSYPGQ